MKRLSRRLAQAACGLAVSVPQLAAAEARSFRLDGGESRIQFVSDAPLERITGVSQGARGEVEVDPAQPAQAHAEVRVKVASLRTNIELRDEHLRSDSWLDAARYPDIVFELSQLSGIAALKPNDVVEAVVNGHFSLHGVTRDVQTRARVRWVPAAAGGDGSESLRVQASFVVHLEDYKVSISSIVKLKVSPDIQVNLDPRQRGCTGRSGTRADSGTSGTCAGAGAWGEPGRCTCSARGAGEQAHETGARASAHGRSAPWGTRAKGGAPAGRARSSRGRAALACSARAAVRSGARVAAGAPTRQPGPRCAGSGRRRPRQRAVGAGRLAAPPHSAQHGSRADRAAAGFTVDPKPTARDNQSRRAERTRGGVI